VRWLQQHGVSIWTSGRMRAASSEPVYGSKWRAAFARWRAIDQIAQVVESNPRAATRDGTSQCMRNPRGDRQDEAGRPAMLLLHVLRGAEGGFPDRSRQRRRFSACRQPIAS